MIALANKYIEKENVDALILACTELPLAIKPEDVNVPIVNTTQVHIKIRYNKLRKFQNRRIENSPQNKGQGQRHLVE